MPTRRPDQSCGCEACVGADAHQGVSPPGPTNRLETASSPSITGITGTPYQIPICASPGRGSAQTPDVRVSPDARGSMEGAVLLTKVFPENKSYANLIFRFTPLRGPPTALRHRRPKASVTTISPSSRHGSRKKLDETRFSSNCKIFSANPLKRHKTAKEIFGKT